MMRRDNNAGNNSFHGPPYAPHQPNISFLSLPPKPQPQLRETQTLDLPQPLHPKNSDALNNRLSHDVAPTQPNNAFAHLRNEISNLRSEFTRLIQKDPNNPSERSHGEARGSFGVKRQDRLPTYSTMGFYNTAKTAEVASESNREPPAINFKNKTVGLEKSPLEIEIDKKRYVPKTEDPVSRLPKRYSSQLTDKKPQGYLMMEAVLQNTKMQELQVQIRKLGELKHKAEQENAFLRREITKRETEYFEKIELLANDLDKSRIMIDQTNISLSLKNSLVQKLQKEIERYVQEVEICQKQAGSAQEQTLRLRQKYETQIRNLEGIHSKNIEDIIEKYRTAEDRIHRLGEEIKEKDQSISAMQHIIEELKQSVKCNKESELLIEQLQKTNLTLKEQMQKLQSSLQDKQANIETLIANIQQAQKQAPSSLTQQIVFRLKQIQQENTDLKKRVDSYKKTVEQLNNANNSARQKQVVFKQQAKVLKEQNKKQKEEIKILAEQVHIKQSLITSLYRDISILDNEIRVSSHLKNLLAQFSRYIDELNACILSLQSQKLNAKYAH